MKTTKYLMVALCSFAFMLAALTAFAHGGVPDISQLGPRPTATTGGGGGGLGPRNGGGGTGDAGTISANAPTMVQLSGSGPADLIYTATSSETISVSARSLAPSGTLDLTVEVLNASGSRLDFNDDHGTERVDLDTFDSLISDLTLPGAGDYTIRVNTFSGSGTGNVEVILSTVAQTPEPVVTDVPGGDGEVITGTVPDNGTYTLDVELAQGDVLTITVRGLNNFDPRVALLDVKDRVVAENDDHGTDDTSIGRFDSRIENVQITAAGTYTIEIAGFGGTGGDFELMIEGGTGGGGVVVTPVATPDVTPVASPTAEPDTEVDVVTGTIAPNEVFIYALEAEAGDMYTITARALNEELDTRLAIYNADNFFVAGNEDHAAVNDNLGIFDAQIERFIFSEAGRYEVEVLGYQGTSGDFDLTVERVATGVPEITDEQVFVGEIQPSGVFTQDFALQAGDYVSITVRALSTGFDPRVALLSPSGDVLAENDDHGMSGGRIAFLDSHIPNLFVDESGTYSVEVAGWDVSAGSFGVTVSIRR